jgi:multidrug efflux pump subunit AcrA (membrane-fusion protein)
MRGRSLRDAYTVPLCEPGCRQEAPPPDLPPRAIQWARVSGALALERRVISGIVTAIEDTRLAFEVNGTVQTVEVDLGDAVEEGQVLARLDPEPLELTVRDAEAALAEARALRAHAVSTLARYEQAGAAVARQEVDRARAMRDSRKSQLDAAQARLNLARRDSIRPCGWPAGRRPSRWTAKRADCASKCRCPRP